MFSPEAIPNIVVDSDLAKHNNLAVERLPPKRQIWYTSPRLLTVCARLYSKLDDPFCFPKRTHYFEMVVMLAWIWPICLVAYFIRTLSGRSWPPEN